MNEQRNKPTLDYATPDADDMGWTFRTVVGVAMLAVSAVVFGTWVVARIIQGFGSF